MDNLKLKVAGLFGPSLVTVKISSLWLVGVIARVVPPLSKKVAVIELLAGDLILKLIPSDSQLAVRVIWR